MGSWVDGRNVGWSSHRKERMTWRLRGKPASQRYDNGRRTWGLEKEGDYGTRGWTGKLCSAVASAPALGQIAKMAELQAFPTSCPVCSQAPKKGPVQTKDFEWTAWILIASQVPGSREDGILIRQWDELLKEFLWQVGKWWQGSVSP